MGKFFKVGAEIAVMALAGVSLGTLVHMEVFARKRGSSLVDILDNSMEVICMGSQFMPELTEQMKSQMEMMGY